MTFSIAGCDVEAEQVGVAVASKFLAVGAVVPWLEAGVGAVATQSFSNVAYGPDGLKMLAAGSSPRVALDELTSADADRAQRQAGIVDARGRSASFTGDACMPWAGGRTGRGYAAQGNILVGPDVIDRMADTFEGFEGPLVDRLLAALQAGDQAGGDRRGRQSAAIAIYAPKAGYAGLNDQLLDLRVDDHPDPVVELMRLRTIHEVLSGTTPEQDLIVVEGALRDELEAALAALGYRDSGLARALAEWVGVENLEARTATTALIDPVVLTHLRAQAASMSS